MVGVRGLTQNRYINMAPKNAVILASNQIIGSIMLKFSSQAHMGGGRVAWALH